MSSTEYIDPKEINKLKYKIKLIQCSHCKSFGMLIMHDNIYGYTEKRERKIKGKRVYCSNRNKRTGCGKTITYRIIYYLKNNSISTNTAWKFLSSILKGKSIEKAYNTLNPEYEVSLTTFFRFYKKFKNQIYIIRTRLADKYQIIKTEQLCPYRETIEQLQKIFENNTNNPIAEYQKTFNTTFI